MPIGCNNHESLRQRLNRCDSTRRSVSIIIPNCVNSWLNIYELFFYRSWQSICDYRFSGGTCPAFDRQTVGGHQARHPQNVRLDDHQRYRPSNARRSAALSQSFHGRRRTPRRSHQGQEPANLPGTHPPPLRHQEVRDRRKHQSQVGHPQRKWAFYFCISVNVNHRICLTLHALLRHIYSL